MSWMFGVLSHSRLSQHHSLLRSLHPNPLFQRCSDQLYVATGGIAPTCFFHDVVIAGQHNGWVVVGSAMCRDGNGIRCLQRSDWERLLSHPGRSLNTLDGHFAVVQWDGDRANCFVDQLGMRLLYIAKTPLGVVFSTRLTWVCRLLPQINIDFHAMGSRWLLFNQLGSASLVENISRIPPGGKAEITTSSFTIGAQMFVPQINESGNEAEFIGELRRYAFPQTFGDEKISLGISGGLDSRLLLSLLHADHRESFSLHVFGDPEDPDTIIAQRIAQSLRIPIQHFDEPLPESSVSVEMLREYLSQTCSIEPASSMLKLRYYPRLGDQKKVVIDGGLGEIARRQYAKRLAFLGRKGLSRREAGSIRKYLGRTRAPIFHSSINARMEDAVQTDAGEIFRKLPSVDEIGVENWIDLFVLHTRFPNMAAYEQSRMDGEVVSWMPFAQPSVLNKVFTMPIDVRKNGNTFRNAIRQCSPSLTRFPLVKGELLYPFRLSGIPLALWTKLRQASKPPAPHHRRIGFLISLSEFVHDTIHSRHFLSADCYDRQFITSVVRRFYQGDLSAVEDLDWWLSFEMWRQSVTGDG